MDAWYASMEVMKAIEKLSEIYYVPLKRNRLVNDTDGVEPHQQVQDLSWDPVETLQGKRVHLNKFPKGHQRRHGIYCDKRFISIKYGCDSPRIPCALED